MTFRGQAPSFANYRHKKYPEKGKEHPYKKLADYKKRVKKKAKEAAPAIRAQGATGEPKAVDIYAVNQRADADNIRKGIKDAMQGVFYDNDKTIGGAEWPIKDPKQKAHVRVEVVW
jgi:Holliday junction resolvase RusA-like endonuclease